MALDRQFLFYLPSEDAIPPRSFICTLLIERESRLGIVIQSRFSMRLRGVGCGRCCEGAHRKAKWPWYGGY